MSEFQSAGVNARDTAASMVGLFPHHAPASSRNEPDHLAHFVDEFDNRILIRTANEAQHHSRASSLIQRRYAWRGYAASASHRTPDGRMTFSACIDDNTVATLTAGLDAEEGLYVANVYPDVVNALRDEGRKLCEFTRLAVDESVRSHVVLGSIIHVAFMYVINLHHCTDVLIEVNPRHVRFYERMLGFTVAASQRNDPAVGAPAVLMRLDLAHCAREIERIGGNRRMGGQERAYYAFFFPREEAARIVSRLRGH
jgi:hypothetical protein